MSYDPSVDCPDNQCLQLVPPIVDIECGLVLDQNYVDEYNAWRDGVMTYLCSSTVLFENSEEQFLSNTSKGLLTGELTFNSSANAGCRNIAIVKVDLVAACGGGTMDVGQEQNEIVYNATCFGDLSGTTTSASFRLNFLSAANAGYFNVPGNDRNSSILYFPIVNGEIKVNYQLFNAFVFDSDPNEFVDVNAVTQASINARVIGYMNAINNNI